VPRPPSCASHWRADFFYKRDPPPPLEVAGEKLGKQVGELSDCVFSYVFGRTLGIYMDDASAAFHVGRDNCGITIAGGDAAHEFDLLEDCSVVFVLPGFEALSGNLGIEVEDDKRVGWT